MKNLKKEIQELKKRLAVLEGMVSEQQITKDYGQFVPKNNDDYFFIYEEGFIKCDDLLNDCIINFHNAFPTQQSAEAEAKYTLISRQYRNFARKLNGDWKPDWSDLYQKKYGVEIIECIFEIEERSINNYFIHQVSFKYHAHAQLALEVFGDDLLVLCN